MAHRLLGEVDGTVPDLKSMFLNEKNKAGNTALHWACRKGSEAFAKALVLWNPNYTIRNNEGETAIDLAWLNMHDAIVEYLRSPCRQAGMYFDCKSQPFHDKEDANFLQRGLSYASHAPNANWTISSLNQ